MHSTTLTAPSPKRLPRLGLWLRNWRTRRRLLTLDPARLDDLGLTAAQVRQEVRKPPWRS